MTAAKDPVSWQTLHIHVEKFIPHLIGAGISKNYGSIFLSTLVIKT